MISTIPARNQASKAVSRSYAVTLTRAPALATEAIGSMALAVLSAAAFVSLVRERDPEAARLLVAEGAILALSFKIGATLLKTLDLQSWDRIAAFAAVLALRMVLKQAFFSAKRTRLAVPGTGRGPTER